jgi:sec-independent protein translocase protein TatA
MESNLIKLNTVFLIGMLGGSERLVIFFAVLLLFGGKNIPELMRGVGKGIREFNDAKEGVKMQPATGLTKQNKN